MPSLIDDRPDLIDPAPGSRWRHKQRGHVYEVITGCAALQCSAAPEFERMFDENTVGPFTAALNPSLCGSGRPLSLWTDVSSQQTKKSVHHAAAIQMPTPSLARGSHDPAYVRRSPPPC